jgi:LmbE family N-acetylglucosaminyl deacetylase
MFCRLQEELEPDVVFVPCSTDTHQSHEVVFSEARRAFKHTTLLGYELPWNNFTLSTDVFVEVAEENIEAKRRAILAYNSQSARPFVRNDVAHELARVRGIQANCTYAECFEAIRIFL